MSLLEYIIAIIIVILILTGFAILAFFLRPTGETAQQPKEKKQEAEAADELSGLISHRPKRGFLDIFKRSERTLG